MSLWPHICKHTHMWDFTHMSSPIPKSELLPTRGAEKRYSLGRRSNAFQPSPHQLKCGVVVVNENSNSLTTAQWPLWEKLMVPIQLLSRELISQNLPLQLTFLFHLLKWLESNVQKILRQKENLLKQANEIETSCVSICLWSEGRVWFCSRYFLERGHTYRSGENKKRTRETSGGKVEGSSRWTRA